MHLPPPPATRSPLSRAVILAAGLGTRMRAHDDGAALTPEQAAAADQGTKGMIPIGRPFLDYLLSAIADAGIAEVCLVVSPAHDAIRAHYTRGVSLRRLRVSFAEQARPIGTADAVLAARAFVGDDPFLVMNADNHYPAEVLRALAACDGAALPAFERETLVRDGNIPPERIARYALLDVDDGGHLRRIVEKPDPATVAAMGEHAAVSMNCWRLTSEIMEACRCVPPSARGEVELPNAVQWAIDQLGMRVRALPTRAAVLDLSQRSDVPAVAARLAATTVTL